MPIGESEYRDIISWKNKQKNQWKQREMEKDGETEKGEDGQSAGGVVWVCTACFVIGRCVIQLQTKLL